MFATSPPGSVQALDSAALQHPTLTFWTARMHGTLLGGAVLELKNIYLRLALGPVPMDTVA